ncbi:MAG TPA: S8 family serine peptidase [Chloroflexota bacterium]|nr:S8 family serine peptidase [Chloroflexota bacterium]
MRVGTGAAAALLVVALGAGDAAAEDFVASSSKWGQAETDAIVAAGGSVKFSHNGTGLAWVSSDSADFVAQAMATGLFGFVVADQVVQWQPDARQIEMDDAAIDPSNDTFYPIQWAPRAIDAPAAWAAGCDGSGVRVAILDGGIYSAHPDLNDNIDTARSISFVAGQPYNNDTGTFWHGTHVAGIVAAEDNNIGVVGIAPKATIIGVKVLHNGTGSFGAVISGILHAAAPIADGGAGADIINMSLGATFPKAGGAGTLIGALAKAVNYADRHGVLVVSAAGNNGLDLDHAKSVTSVPAQSGSGMAVSATAPVGWALGATNFARLASYSNYGVSVVNVAAPGGDFAYPGNENCTMATATSTITRPCWVFDLVLSTSRAGYSWAAGTSMAAPAASAVAAIIKQANSGISLGDLKARLEASSLDLGKKGTDPIYGRGWVNALRACTQ